MNKINNLRGIFKKIKNGKRIKDKGRAFDAISTYGFIIKTEK